MFVSNLLILLVWGLCKMQIFEIEIDRITHLAGHVLLELMVPAMLCRRTKGRPKWMKYILLVEFMIVLARVECVLGYNAILLMVFPVVLSCRYFSRRFTCEISVLTAICFGASSFANAYWNLGEMDLNFYEPPVGTVLYVTEDLYEAVAATGIDRLERTREIMVLSYLPKLMMFCMIAVVCVKIAGKGKTLVLEQKEITLKNSRIESELSLAKDIQTHMLPNIFPPFPDQNEVDLYATMNPAKEVGGDFYDFFWLDEKNIAVVIADVSGKGVPAALVMVITKTLIKNEVLAGDSPAEAFIKVNHMLCEGNDNNMFVTAWMGVLDTETGVLTYVNAGHNPPLVRLADGSFTFLKARSGLVLAVMDGLRYRQSTLQMQPGDRIFLYTDGVTEADNPAKEMYGEDRLQAYLNAHANDLHRDVISGLTADIKTFAGTEPQFDDMTMLMLDYLEKYSDKNQKEKSFPARNEELPQVMGFIEEELKKAKCPTRTAKRILLCVEELFTNVASYAYPDGGGEVSFAITCRNKMMTLRRSDSGIPFDPLKKEDPDVTLPAEERQIGGLGIFIVKKTMDDVHYEYKDGKNILSMKKKWE